MSYARVERKMCEDEYVSFHLYRRLARLPLVSENLRKTLRKAAEDELKHYEFWKSFAGECASIASKLKVLLYTVMFYLFGLTVTLKFIESKEARAASIYENIASEKPEVAGVLKEIVEDEERHEAEFAESIDEGRVKYIGSITLGISDALIELTGIYTGSLGAFENTLSAGLTGLLAGVAASISMGAAAYAQAKHEYRLNPKLSALYTFAAYIAVAAILAAPYFMVSSILVAFTVMMLLATAIVAYVSFYSAVLRSKSYLKEFAETLVMVLGVSLALYVLGSVLGELLGVTRIE